MKKIHFLTTFDYELPLGGVENFNKGLFEPSDRLIDIGKELGVPMVFFVDILCAVQFEKWDNTGFYIPFKEQIMKMLRHNHDMELHIHPHWLTSEFIEGKYVHSSDFSLSSFSDSKNGISIPSIVKFAYNKTLELGKCYRDDYNCIAYRAGGFNLSPNTKEIVESLQKINTLFDSSITKDFYLQLQDNKLDFRKMPRGNFWKISPTSLRGDMSMKGIVELPIASKPVSAIDVIKRRLEKTYKKDELKSRTYNNTGSGFHSYNKMDINSTIKSIFNPQPLTFDSNHLKVSDLMKIVKYNINLYKNNEVVFITAISHPKHIGNYQIGLLTGFVSEMRKTYGDSLEFSTYNSIKNFFYEDSI
ncbi:MAG: hypothetical protein M0P66_03520 [Salinivirgaceae bacterium]|nr:hypothetical protein [Salinivirgaceae bacterium]